MAHRIQGEAMSLSDENIQAWRIAVKAAMTKYAIQTNTDADDALSGIDALCDAALERNRLERELKDWNALVMAMTALGVDKEIRDKANIPDLWPNPWHQDCAMVAFFIKGLIDRSEQAEAALPALLDQLEWRPIETAPRDGRKIMLWYLNGNHKPRTVMGKWLSEEDAVYTDIDGVGLEAGWYECIDNWDDYTEVSIHQGEPTHWKPLPTPPEAP